jgi:hypothetical protein
LGLQLFEDVKLVYMGLIVLVQSVDLFAELLQTGLVLLDFFLAEEGFFLFLGQHNFEHVEGFFVFLEG